MMLEIERKFLVKNDSFKHEVATKTYIAQGYIFASRDKTVRIRIADELGFITIKGKSNDSGMSRMEWEKKIELHEAKELLQLCEPGLIEKTRYIIPIGNHIYEVDVFEGDNEGLIVAEIELQSEEEHFEKPDWLGQEVTGEVEYYNAMLMKNPYKNW